MGRASRGNLVQLLGIDGKTETELDTRAKSLSVACIDGNGMRNDVEYEALSWRLTESEDTRVVDFGLDEGRGVEVANEPVNGRQQ